MIATFEACHIGVVGKQLLKMRGSDTEYDARIKNLVRLEESLAIASSKNSIGAYIPKGS